MKIIKKYPNRRLYDTSASRYINLEDVRKMVLAQALFKVVDSRSDEDLTKTILLQVVSDQESGTSQEILSVAVLLKLIQSYDTVDPQDDAQPLSDQLVELLSR